MLADKKTFLIDTYRRMLSDVQPETLYKKYLHLYDHTLYFKNTALDIDPKGRLVLAGCGKASLAMGRAILPYLPLEHAKSLFISPSEAPDAPFDHIMGDHPIPGKNSLKAGNSMLDMLSSLTENDTLLFFLSGGASSLMEVLPAELEPHDVRSATETFLAKGLNIQEINTLRAGLSRIKAGQLAAACKAKTYVFVLSDVMGNDMSVIGSGPFYRTQASAGKISNIIDTYGLDSCLPDQILQALKNYRPAVPENIPPHFLIGSNMDLLQAAETTCFDAGIKPVSFPESLFGEASKAGSMIADMLRLYSGEKPICMIFGGETTVTLNEHPGLGGRAQELALSVLKDIHDIAGITLLSAGSDGMDGIGGAAGAVVNKQTFAIARSLGLSIDDYLSKHDSYHFHEQCDSLIKTGYSGTNVGDVVLALIS